MKITTRCGPELIESLNAALIAKAVEAGVIEMGWLRADTTVVPADIKYPTDSGLLTIREAFLTSRDGSGLVSDRIERLLAGWFR